MKLDKSIKIMLFMVTLFLGIIALKPLMKPEIAYASPIARLNIAVLHGGVDPDYPNRNHTIILDLDNGHVWDYTYDALSGKADPVFVGTISKLGASSLEK